MMESSDFGMRTYVSSKERYTLRPQTLLIRMRQLEYKGYIGQFTYDEDRELFEGKIVNVSDIIIFHGKSVESLNFAFHDAIKDYLSWCKRIGKKPEKPFSLPDH